MNSVVLTGRLTKDPELRYTPGDGKPVVNFTLAVNRGYKNKDGNNEADFIYIEAWNKQAENVAQYCFKGSLVAIQGSIRTEKYTYQEQNRTITKIRANQVDFLSNKNSNENPEEPTFVPSFENELNPNEWKAVDDDEIPF